MSQENLLTQTFEDYLAHRDLNLFPTAELEQLETVEEFKLVVEAAVEYLHNLQSGVGLEQEYLNHLAHAVVSHLIKLNSEGEQALAAFLLPSSPPAEDLFIDTEDEDVQKTAISEWEVEHEERNKHILKQVRNIISKEGPGQIFIIEGNMYSAKSDALMRIAKNLFDTRINGYKYSREDFHAFGFGGFEDGIKSRVGGRGRENPIKTTQEVEETKRVFLDGLLAALNDLTPKQGMMILIDEYSFLSGSTDESDLLAGKLKRFAQKGVTIIVAGLNANFKDEQLPVSHAFEVHSKQERNIFKRLEQCVAFAVHPKTRRSIPAETTTRYDLFSGEHAFADLIMPIVIGREHKFVKYGAIPKKAHIFRHLMDNDKEVYEMLNQISDTVRERTLESRIKASLINEA